MYIIHSPVCNPRYIRQWLPLAPPLPISLANHVPNRGFAASSHISAQSRSDFGVHHTLSQVFEAPSRTRCLGTGFHSTFWSGEGDAARQHPMQSALGRDLQGGRRLSPRGGRRFSHELHKNEYYSIYIHIYAYNSRPFMLWP